MFGRRTAVLMAVLLLAACGDGGQDGTHPPQAAGTALRVATESAYPPFVSVDPTGTLVGFDMDVVQEMCKRLERRCDVIPQSWDGIIPGLLANRYDAITGGMTITAERRRVVAFTRPYVSTPLRFFAPRDRVPAGLAGEPALVTLDTLDAGEQAALERISKALAGRSVGVQSGTTAAEFADAQLAAGATVRRYDTHENLVLDLAAGRIDAGLADSVVVEPYLASEAGKGVTVVGPAIEGGPVGEGIGIAVRQGDTDLQAKMDGALAAMQADGTLRTLATKWFGADVSAPAPAAAPAAAH